MLTGTLLAGLVTESSTVEWRATKMQWGLKERNEREGTEWTLNTELKRSNCNTVEENTAL